MNGFAQQGQLALAVRLHESATFGNFVPGPNASCLAAVRGDDPFVFLWGAEGTGKSHLLQAMCHGRNGEAIYLPLGTEGLAPAMLDGLETYPLICIDDIQHAAGVREWEMALFGLYNGVRDAGGRLRVAADGPPGSVGIELADLRSRLGWGPVFHLCHLGDQDKIAAIRLRAAGFGFDLSEEVARYILRRCPRDMHHLFGLLERLDAASLAAKRKVTIPFVRDLLAL